MSSNTTIVKNSIFLFIRTLIIMGVSLYTSRIVLSVLGIEDFGIYNVVGGVVSMLSFLNSAMVQASQRYMSIAQETGNILEQKIIFSTSILTHLTIAFIALLVLETLGLWYVNNKMVIPTYRLYAANVIYQFSILIFIARIIVVPYTSSVIAHEEMHIYAYISMFDAILQFIFIFFLKFIRLDKLILYVLLLLIIAVINYIIYYSYCKVKYSECRFCMPSSWNIYKEMFSYASWAFVGGFGFVARNQGVNLVINLFCGPAVNAARGVAYQVSSAIQTLISSFQQAINPQIIKRYAAQKNDSMIMLINMGAKYSYLLLLICFTPFLIRPEYVLTLWLGQVPQYASEFMIMSIGMTLIISMGSPLITAMQATGKIKIFQICVTSIMCCDIPFAYILLKMHVEPYLVTGISILTSIICLFVELFLLSKEIKINIKTFIFSIFLKNIGISIFIIPFIYYVSLFIPENVIGFIILCILSTLFYGVIIYFICFDSWEKDIFYNKIKSVFKHLH